ncbi:MAG: 50S ribosomal protein L10 [Nanoarchaeota archaeon]
MKSKETKRKIPKKKIAEVESLKNLIKSKKTILIASIKNIPASQFQEISKSLRGKAVVKVPKKNLIIRAIDSSDKKELEELKESIKENTTILFSDLDAFDLAAELIKNKSYAKAKAGQEAPEDIEVQEGPTELIPGPAISELGALGIQIQIEKGKIHIKQSKIIAKKGEKISQPAAEVMAKLDIKPFVISLIPLAAFDNTENKVYKEINIDPEGTLNGLRNAFTRSLAFAVSIAYTCQGTIKLLIAKAGRNEKAIENLMVKTDVPQVNSEEEIKNE